MTSINRIRSRVTELQEERDRLNRQIEEALREERELQSKLREPEAGSMVLIEAVFPGTSGRTYQYVAMNTDTGWYVTGQKGKMTWDGVLNLVRHARSVEIFDLDFNR